MPFDTSVPGQAVPGKMTPAYPVTAGAGTGPFSATKTQPAKTRIRNTATRAQTATATIKGVAGTINNFLFFMAGAATPCTELHITDLNHLPVRQETRTNWVSDDEGTVCTLTTSDDTITACAVGVGQANVTVTSFEDGLNVSGTLTVIVFVGDDGELYAAWESGTITLTT